MLDRGDFEFGLDPKQVLANLKVLVAKMEQGEIIVSSVRLSTMFDVEDFAAREVAIRFAQRRPAPQDPVTTQEDSSAIQE